MSCDSKAPHLRVQLKDNDGCMRMRMPLSQGLALQEGSAVMYQFKQCIRAAAAVIETLWTLVHAREHTTEHHGSFCNNVDVAFSITAIAAQHASLPSLHAV